MSRLSIFDFYYTEPQVIIKSFNYAVFINTIINKRRHV